MHSKAATILTLSGLALAHPHRFHLGPRHPRVPAPELERLRSEQHNDNVRPAGEAPFANGCNNSTVPLATGSVTSSTSLPLVTEEAGTGSNEVSDLNLNQKNVAVNDVSPEEGDALCDATSTATATATNFITLTIEARNADYTEFAPAPQAQAGNYDAGNYNVDVGGVLSTIVNAPVASNPFPTASPSGNYGTPGTNPGSVTSPGSGTGVGAGNSTGGGVSTGGKKGVSYNDISLLSIFDDAPVAWAYNWASGPGGQLPNPNIEYRPMVWGEKSLGEMQSIQAAIDAGSTHVLSFNEPDHPDQAAMDPSKAAKLHIQYLNQFSGSAQISSPAITNGGDGMGIDWLRNWFEACNGECACDYVAYHWYSPPDIESFQQHTQDVIDLAAQYGVNQVMLTEYGLTSGSDSEQANFVQQSMEFLESKDEVAGYCYFMAASGTGMLLNGNALSAVGKAYTSF